MGLAAVAVIAAWFGVDLGYSRVVDHKLKKWESSIERDANGIRVGCQEFTMGNGKTALLMIHGFGDSPQVWSYMAPYFADEGYTCRGILLPGFAQEMSVYKTTDRIQWRDKIKTELAELRKTHDTVFIVAHSLGSSCSINVLLEDPHAADGIVAFAPLIGVSNQRSPILSARRWFKIVDKIQVFTQVIASAYDPNMKNQEELKSLKVDRFIPRKVFREMFAVMEDNEKRAQDFTTPIMIIATDKDMVVDVKKTEAFYENISSSEKGLIRHNQAGHVIPRDYGWQETAEATHIFLLRQKNNNPAGEQQNE